MSKLDFITDLRADFDKYGKWTEIKSCLDGISFEWRQNGQFVHRRIISIRDAEVLMGVSAVRKAGCID